MNSLEVLDFIREVREGLKEADLVIGQVTKSPRELNNYINRFSRFIVNRANKVNQSEPKSVWFEDGRLHVYPRNGEQTIL